MTAETDTLVKEIHIEASPETVFGYFTEAEKLTRWFCSEATTDPRVGGINHQTHPGPEDAPRDFYMRGEFLEVDFPNRVVFTFNFLDEDGRPDPNPGTVEITLTPAGGGTDLRLVHTDTFTGEERSRTDGGWDTHLANLAELLSS